jgi:predicted nucleic acid-binding protein
LNRFVLDTSIAVTWCFEDEDSAQADRILALLASREALVPPVWLIEVGNALLAGARRTRITVAEISRSLKLLMVFLSGSPPLRAVRRWRS